ncbi:hypothetical protein, partial [Pedobacter steynii]
GSKMRSVTMKVQVFNQLGTASLGCFRIYRETLSRFRARFVCKTKHTGLMPKQLNSDQMNL